MPFIELDPDRAEELIHLHIVATTRLARAALPGMVARGRGAVVNVASMLAFSAFAPGSSPLPKRAIYAACKAYIVAFSELLQHELDGSGVQVQALCPGIVAGTEFHDSIAGFDRSRLAQAGLMPEDVVTASLAGLRLGEVICAPGLDDVASIEQFRASEQQLVARGARGGLAPRYIVT
jgi:short-subunit dehydrogenase